MNIGEVLSDRFEEQIRKNAIEEGARKLSLYLEKKKIRCICCSDLRRTGIAIYVTANLICLIVTKNYYNLQKCKFFSYESYFNFNQKRESVAILSLAQRKMNKFEC